MPAQVNVVNSFLICAQVMHLAETLAANGVDTESVVFPALAPLVIDVFVQRAAKYRSNIITPPNQLNQDQELRQVFPFRYRL